MALMSGAASQVLAEAVQGATTNKSTGVAVVQLTIGCIKFNRLTEEQKAALTQMIAQDLGAAANVGPTGVKDLVGTPGVVSLNVMERTPDSLVCDALIAVPPGRTVADITHAVVGEGTKTQIVLDTSSVVGIQEALECPLSAANVQVLATEADEAMAMGPSQLESAKRFAEQHADIALEGAKNDTASAASAVAQDAVKEVALTAEREAGGLIDYAKRMEVQAVALEAEAQNATRQSEEATATAERWMAMLPTARAEQAGWMGQSAVRTAQDARLRSSSAESVAKHAKDLAVESLREVAEASARSHNASLVALQAVQQATQNSHMLTTIRQLITEVQRGTAAANAESAARVTGIPAA